jgi:hypothetical protein
MLLVTPRHLVLAVVLASCAVPATAAAQGPRPCGPEVASEAKLAVPDRVAYGRSASAIVENAFHEIDVSFGPAEEGAPLSSAYTGRFAPYNPFPISFARGDGPAVLRATFAESQFSQQYAPDYRCVRTLEARVQPIDGVSPGIGRTVDYGTTLVLKLVGSGECVDMRPGRITLKVRGGRSRRDLVLRDICSSWRIRSVPDFKARFSNDDDESYPLLELEPRERSVNTARRYTVTAFFRGRRLRTVRFRVRWEYSPRRRIDEAEDDFVNVCINDPDITIWKKNGRLYCIEPAFRAVHVRLLP